MLPPPLATGQCGLLVLALGANADNKTLIRRVSPHIVHGIAMIKFITYRSSFVILLTMNSKPRTPRMQHSSSNSSSSTSSGSYR